MTDDLSRNGHPGLRATLQAACADAECGLGEMTVLATQNDPFRVDTPSSHRDGEWLAVNANELGLGDRVVHLRGLHYMLVSGETFKPDGSPYTNTDKDWAWLVNGPAKAARWLGYLPFDQVKDARSTPPVIRTFTHGDPWAFLSTGVEVEIPDADEIEPVVNVLGFTGTQPYKIVLFGEKTSLEDVLAPIAESHEADLYLPAGEISDSQIHTMAQVGAEDERPMIVLTISDCDPAGWQMPISIGRKLQAFKAFKFPELQFQVHRVALTSEHVGLYGLPSSPLKETEKRADRWFNAKGVEQTEVDALAALRPDLLTKLVLQAVRPFFDSTLQQRVLEAKNDWLEQAQQRLEEQLDQDELDRIRTQAAEKLEQLEAQIEAINEAMKVDIGELDLPEIVVPETRTKQPQPHPTDQLEMAVGLPDRQPEDGEGVLIRLREDHEKKQRQSEAMPPNPLPAPSLPHDLGATQARATVRIALSPDEAAAALGVSRDYLDEHVAPELRWVRRGRRKFVAIRELEAWLDRAAARTVER